MSMKPTFASDKYEDGRTKQAFKDQADINKILAKAQRTGSIAHLVKHGAHYGDFSDITDLLDAYEKLKRGQKIFDELPAEVKREFNQNPGEFFQFVNNPANADRLTEVLPAIAKPGNQVPDINKKVAQATGGASLPADPVAGNTAPQSAGDRPANGGSEPTTGAT